MRSHRTVHLLLPTLALLLGACVTTPSTDPKRLEVLQERVEILASRLRALESRREQVPIAVAKARAAVAFIWGTYTFVDDAGRPLRHVLDETGEPIANAKGVPMVDLTGTGAVAVQSYSGTAFLVDREGALLTNRHIAEPWWDNEDATPLLDAGLRSAFLQLRAFFQERADPVPVEVLRVDPELDVALMRTVGWTPTADPLPIHPEPNRITEGQAVMLVGFPTGLDAVLSKLSDQEYAALERAGGAERYATAEYLAREDRLSATITGGFVWEIRPHVLVYDARTSGGGSGGPVLDRQGQVIGVNAAYLEEFEGGNYGVPIQAGLRLMSGEGQPATAASRERPDLLPDEPASGAIPVKSSGGAARRSRR
jgi:S1-C subfamily serine protease